MGIFIMKRATQRARILLTDNIHSGGNCSVNNNNSHKGFCPLKIEITQFPDGFRLNLLIKTKN